ncbi:MAG: BspA family leucine-rich repeat surface protein [Clostridiales Family XIII bacterium]|jgi:fimbrial isopeptide formation D2 family protein|nr:BspA family leucine-rich repeat surface protein [Clostridiales Family XIII bacterium]
MDGRLLKEKVLLFLARAGLLRFARNDEMRGGFTGACRSTPSTGRVELAMDRRDHPVSFAATPPQRGIKAGRRGLGKRLGAVALAFALLFTTIVVDIAGTGEAHASGPEGDVIYNYPYNPPTATNTNGNWSPDFASSINWTYGKDIMAKHSGYDMAYTAESGDFSHWGVNHTPDEKELASAGYRKGTSGYFNGAPTPDHTVIKDNRISFFGYAKPSYMDYLFTEEYSGIHHFEFNLYPEQMIFHTFYESGFFFNGTMENGYYTGYAIIMQCGNAEGMMAGGTATFKLYYIDGEKWDEYCHPDFAKRKHIATFKTGIQNQDETSFHISIDIDPESGAFDLYVDDTHVASETSTRVVKRGGRGGEGFGFFTGYYDHSCSILTVIRYDDFMFKSGTPEPIPVDATVKFRIGGDENTVIRPDETEIGYYKQYYKIVQPPEIEYEGEIYRLINNSRSLSVRKDMQLEYLGVSKANETTLYYILDSTDSTDSNDGDPKKTARVNDGAWDTGEAEDPIVVKRGDTVEYKIDIPVDIELPMLALGSTGTTAADVYNQPNAYPNVGKANIRKIRFVNFQKNYGSSSSFIKDHFIEGTRYSVWVDDGVEYEIIKAWDATYAESDSVNRVIAFIVPNSTQPSGGYTLYLGGFGGVRMSDFDGTTMQFRGFDYLTESFDFTNFYTDRAKNMDYMFYGVNIHGLEDADLSTLNTSNVTSMMYMFYNTMQTTGVDDDDDYLDLDLTGFDTKNVKTFNGMFSIYTYSGRDSFIRSIDLSNFDMSSAEDLTRMFEECENLETLKINNWYFTKPVNMYYMFKSCRSLDFSDIDFSTWRNAQPTNMQNAFDACTYLETIDLRNFDLSKLTNLYYTFMSCTNLKNFMTGVVDFETVPSMSGAFRSCSNLEVIDLSRWTFPEGYSLGVAADMFKSCTRLKSLYIEDWKFKSGTTNNGTPMISGSAYRVGVYCKNEDVLNSILLSTTTITKYLVEDYINELTFPDTLPIWEPNVTNGATYSPQQYTFFVIDEIPEHMTIIDSVDGITGGASHSVDADGRTITWTLNPYPDTFPDTLTVKVKADDDTPLDTHFDNFATLYRNSDIVSDTNYTYHLYKDNNEVNEQYYIYDGGASDVQLAPDNNFNGYLPIEVSQGDDFLLADASAPTTLSGHYYYGYQYIDPDDDPDRTNPGEIHEGTLPDTIFSNINGNKTIRYFYTPTPTHPIKHEVVVRFFDDTGKVIKTEVVDSLPVGGDYYMPMSYLNTINDGSKDWNYYDYKLSNPAEVPTDSETPMNPGPPPVGTQPDMSVVENMPQFANINETKYIDLYFTDTPVVTVHFAEYLNESHILKNEISYFVASGSIFTPSASLRDNIITNIGKKYEYVNYWSLDDGALTLGNPANIENVTKNHDLTLYFRTKFNIVEKYHGNDYEVHHDGEIVQATELHAPDSTDKYGGESFTGTPPLSFPDPDGGDTTWYYIGYRAIDDDNAYINPGYPPAPLVPNVTDDYTFIYVYEQRATDPDEPTISKTASVYDDSLATWRDEDDSGDVDRHIPVSEGDIVKYTISVNVPENYSGVNAGGEIKDFDSAGMDMYIAPVEGDYILETWGAQGGFGGGRGGYSKGEVHLTAGETLYVYVGGLGFNGGGTAGDSSFYGGGGTDIRIGVDSLYSRVIVAGGGGGTSDVRNGTGGYGGGTSGNSGGKGISSLSSSGGGTQTGGGIQGYYSGGLSQTSGFAGSFGLGGQAQSSTNGNGGGGGGGWYGGGGGASGYSSQYAYAGGGGGGSGFVFTSSNPVSGYALDNKYMLTDAKTIAGNLSMPNPNGGTMIGKTGVGFARITPPAAGIEPITVNDTLPKGLTYVPGTARSSDNRAVFTSSPADPNGRDLQWQTGGLPIGTSTFTVQARVNKASGVFINTATALIDEKTLISNSTFHEAGFSLTERFRDYDDLTDEIRPDQSIAAEPDSEYIENVRPIDGWEYVGWYLDDDAEKNSGNLATGTANPETPVAGTLYPGSPTPAQIIASIKGPHTITYVYKKGLNIKAADPATGTAVQTGDEIEYTVTGVAEEAGTLEITDELDERLGVPYDIDNDGVYTAGTHTIKWEFSGLSAGVKKTVKFRAKVVGITGAVRNEAGIKNNAAQKTTNETEHPIENLKRANPSSGTTVNTGSEITYTVTGTATKAGDMTITDKLDSLLGVPTAHTDASGTYVYDDTTHTITWEFAGLSIGDTRTVTFTSKVSGNIGPVLNQAEIDNKGDVRLTNETEHPIDNPKTATPPSGSTVQTGEAIAYTIKGVAEAAGSLTITDKLDQKLGEPTVYFSDGGNYLYNPSTHTITWTFTGLSKGDTKIVQFTSLVVGELGVVKNKADIIQNDSSSKTTNETEHPIEEPDDRIVPLISAEVDKDTIRRTSAAYVSLPGKEGFDNVGLADERYRYDIDFRSTSNVPLDEFVVDDPLEAVTAGQIVLEELLTPVTWGDEDGKLYVLYQTNKAFKGEPGIDSNPSKKNKNYSNKGYRLWAGPVSADSSSYLAVSDLGLAKGEYITAVRFDFGAVAVGFTSKNYSDVSQNGEWRDKDGNIILPTKEDAAKIVVLAEGEGEDWIAGQARNDSAGKGRAGLPRSARNDGSKGEGTGTGEGKDWIAGQARNDRALATGLSGNVGDWRPVSGRGDYAAGAAAATGLAPAMYLVSAAQAMDEVNIVTSVSAKAAKENATDFDQDAVLTRVFSSFEMNPEVFDPSGSISENSFIENAEKNGVVMRGGKWYDAKTGKPLDGSELSEALGGGGIAGNGPKTGDEMAFWIWILLASFAGALLVMGLRSRRRLKGGATL